MAQFTVNAQRFDPYKNFKFRVKWDGRYVAGVSKVGALKRTHRGGRAPRGRRPVAPAASRRAAPKYEAITLERGVTHDTEFEQWANKVWNFGSGLGAEVSLKDFRKDLIIEVYNEAGQLVHRLQGLPLLGLGVPGAARPRRQRQRRRDPDTSSSRTRAGSATTTSPSPASRSSPSRRPGRTRMPCRSRRGRELLDLWEPADGAAAGASARSRSPRRRGRAPARRGAGGLPVGAATPRLLALRAALAGADARGDRRLPGLRRAGGVRGRRRRAPRAARDEAAADARSRPAGSSSTWRPPDRRRPRAVAASRRRGRGRRRAARRCVTSAAGSTASGATASPTACAARRRRAMAEADPLAEVLARRSPALPADGRSSADVDVAGFVWAELRHARPAAAARGRRAGAGLRLDRGRGARPRRRAGGPPTSSSR